MRPLARAFWKLRAQHGQARTTVYRTTWAKRLGMVIFAKIVAHFSHRPVTDPTSGFQAMNRDLLAFFARDNYPSDYPDADTLLLLNYAGFRVAEVPVCMRDRLAGVSMHTSWKVFYYIFKMFLSIFIVLLRQKTNGNARRRQASSQAPKRTVRRGGGPVRQGITNGLSIDLEDWFHAELIRPYIRAARPERRVEWATEPILHVARTLPCAGHFFRGWRCAASPSRPGAPHL